MMEDTLTITPLGSGQEVGRSCHLLTYETPSNPPTKCTLLLDCGIHPGHSGMNALPFLDDVPDMAAVDAVLVTHCHLDHAAGLPYLTERTGFRGRVYMTPPTRSIAGLLLGDYLKLTTTEDGNALYTEAELRACMDRVELVDYHQVIVLPCGAPGGGPGAAASAPTSIKFWALNAGHVLGAAMFMIELGGSLGASSSRHVLYTGDYSTEDDRHLSAAEVPNVRPDVLIAESTYGAQVHRSRVERETMFTGTVDRVVSGGGKCLVPVFALGRAQELLLILDEYWENNAGRLKEIPVYYASRLASRALRVYRTYINMMNARIRNAMDITSNPFAFKHIKNLKSADHGDSAESLLDEKSGPCVVFASPGMLQSGMSRKLFDRWCTDPKNGVLIAGYAIEGTLAKEIMDGTIGSEVVTMSGRRVPRNCIVDYVSFSAHVDGAQNRRFIEQVEPSHVVLVHGQKDLMGSFKAALMDGYRNLPENKRPKIFMPPNLQKVKLTFSRRRSAKVMGTLASPALLQPAVSSFDSLPIINDDEGGDNGEEAMIRRRQHPITPPPSAIPGDIPMGTEVSGILVTQNFQSRILSSDDLHAYTQLRVGSVSSKVHVPFVGQANALRLFLREMFSGVREEKIEAEAGPAEEPHRQPVTKFFIHSDRVCVTLGSTPVTAIVAWESGPVEDVLADAAVALLMHAQSSSAAVRMAGRPCNHHAKRARTGGGGEGDLVDNVTRLQLLHKMLRCQYESVQPDFEAGTFVIGSAHADREEGNDTSPVGELSATQPAVCTIKIEFESEDGSNAKLTVEGDDYKMNANVRDCVKNIISTSAPFCV
eukprot:CAMPEP_0194287154 /NCGR_PEP_ID=MMETSP0169-20130528/34082_1 /TAXON_ID=218684 /ORGANISM="Corethron pennatum, Strain L29A3" /LENGTH=821 /DNA_ID=CAMNT_0039033767 /DNA_START=48 /DNA_END=2513 /DNA_ORIENTATION=+